MKTFDKKHKLLFIILISLYVLLFLLSLPGRVPHIDDAWLGEHSYWLLHDGIAKTKLMTNIAHGDERLILHHKLFTLQGAIVIYCCGFSLSALKSVSFVYLLLLVGLFFFIHKKNWFAKREALSLSLLLLLANPLTFEFGFVFRPEIMLSFLGLASAYLIVKPNVSKTTKLHAFISGLIAGLSLATHLNGSIFIAAGSLYLIIKRKWASALLFAAGSIVTSLIYFYDFQSFNDFSYWIHQLTFIPSDNNSSGLFKTFMLSVLDEQRRYFHSPKEIIFTLLIVVSLSFSWKKIKQEQSALLLYTFLAMMAMSVLALNKTSKYFLMILPFVILIISHSYYIILRSKNKNRIRIFNITLLLYLAISLVYNVAVVRQKYDPKINAAITAAYAGDKPSEIRILAPMEFIFNEIGQYERIVGLMSFNERLKLDPNLKADQFLETAKREHIDLILLPGYYQEKFQLIHNPPNTLLNGFRLIEKSDQLMVWKLDTASNALHYTKPRLAYSKYGMIFRGAFK
ncbi:MAG: hypothetical protein H0S84_12665 [Bacteroidales bacterium]|jgi:hypothetical protein|nr:hypothetical protein [Bacteroidales bacterium]